MEASNRGATRHEEIRKSAMKGTAKQLELIAALLGEETTLSLATSGEDGEACVAPLFYIVDKELSLYWLSSESSLHSLNLKRTPRAAATVYRSAKSWKEICGVQLRGVVSKVTEPERRAALVKAYCERFKLGRVFRLALHQSVLYSLRPEFFRYIDNARGFGYKFELTRRPEGWSLTRPGA
jgi:uncharacterized protein YhbP (UPF0306 family)